MQVSVRFGKDQFVKVLNDQLKSLNPNSPEVDESNLTMIGKKGDETIGEVDNVDLVVDLPVAQEEA